MNDWPARIASMAFSTLSIAESRFERSTGMKCARWHACPTMGELKSDFFNRIAILLGIAPTTAGASAELVWFATNRQVLGGIRSTPATRTRTPTARTKNMTPRTPAQYNAPGFLEMTV